MGRQDIQKAHFSLEEETEFKLRLKNETALLKQWFDVGRFANDTPMAGFELEAWLVNKQGSPAAINHQFLTTLNNPLVVPELSAFNIEINTHPLNLTGNCFSQLQVQLEYLWQQASITAEKLDSSMAMIGILPTVKSADLCLENISDQSRYQALNQQIFKLRDGKAIELDIRGDDHLRLFHHDVMLEAAATSYQIHLKVNANLAAKAFNISKIISAPMVAISANSPFLFEHDLWDETRIPLFEQSVSVGDSDYSKRVTFGIRFAEQHIMECFEANQQRYPVLLPQLFDEPVEALAHLRLHNGTIWRWNRPLIDFNNAGEPHVRIEHRVVPAGPTVIDLVANAVFYYGLVAALLTQDKLSISFESVATNFYQAAKLGLNAKIKWLDGKEYSQSVLIEQYLLPLAAQGLKQWGIDRQEADFYLGILYARVQKKQTGAVWQRRYFYQHGKDYHALVLAYLENQQTGKPVHEWTYKNV